MPTRPSPFDSPDNRDAAIHLLHCLWCVLDWSHHHVNAVDWGEVCTNLADLIIEHGGDPLRGVSPHMPFLYNTPTKLSAWTTRCMTWMRTPQGEPYWRDIYNRLISADADATATSPMARSEAITSLSEFLLSIVASNRLARQQRAHQYHPPHNAANIGVSLSSPINDQ